VLLWSVFFVLTMTSVLAVLAPVLWRRRSQGDDADSEMAVYRQQLQEITGDLDAGILSAEQADDARLEVKRRLLRASDRPRSTAANQGGAKRYAPAFIVAVATPVLAALLYNLLGRPDLPAQPVAERVAAAPAAPAQAPETQQPDVGRMVQGLMDRLAAEPDDYNGWLLLGRSLIVLSRHDEAARAYRRATQLPEAENDSTPYSGLAEALVFGAKGNVTPEAKANFEKALGVDPADPGARYSLAEALAQAGDLQAAFDGWLDLARTSPADAPWRDSLLQRLRAAADELGVDLAAALPEGGAEQSAPGPTDQDVAAAGQMAPGDRTAMIRGMVDRLADRLAQEPDDHAGWLRLGKSYGVLGEKQKAAEAYGRAAALAPDDIETLLALAAASVEVSGGGAELPANVAALYRRILSLDPDNPQALWFSGVADAQAGDRIAAAKKWQALLARIPSDAPQYQEIKRRIEDLLESANE
jgi:cytochrome c-type biogenesis protein CcmH